MAKFIPISDELRAARISKRTLRISFFRAAGTVFYCDSQYLGMFAGKYVPSIYSTPVVEKS